ncbi:hypothetical protein G6K86_00020 [Agrobacterium rhizogenes]|nr:hypothetical protein [Rhizobium rhizogenes]
MATLESIREDETNADFIPYARETEEDIRLTRAAMLQIDDADVSVDILENWQNTFAHLASKYIGRAAGICGIFLENVATEAGKELGKTIGKAGGVALTLYLVGVDFHGIAAALVQLIQKLSGV